MGWGRTGRGGGGLGVGLLGLDGVNQVDFLSVECCECCIVASEEAGDFCLRRPAASIKVVVTDRAQD